MARSLVADFSSISYEGDMHIWISGSSSQSEACHVGHLFLMRDCLLRRLRRGLQTLCVDLWLSMEGGRFNREWVNNGLGDSACHDSKGRSFVLLGLGEATHTKSESQI